MNEAINQQARRDKKRAVNPDFSTDIGVYTNYGIRGC
jgi:hypothetical protein